MTLLDVLAQLRFSLLLQALVFGWSGVALIRSSGGSKARRLGGSALLLLAIAPLAEFLFPRLPVLLAGRFPLSTAGLLVQVFTLVAIILPTAYGLFVLVDAVATANEEAVLNTETGSDSSDGGLE